MPLRDDRRGRRATIGSGYGPFRTDFRSASPTAPINPTEAANETPPDVSDVRGGDARADDGAGYSLERSEGSRDLRDIERSGASLISPTEVKTFENAARYSAEPRSLLEPGDFLMAIARPFFGVRAAIIRFANYPIARSESSTQGLTVEDLGATGVSGRSFASEVASLLQAPAELTAPLEGGSEAVTTRGVSEAWPKPLAAVAAASGTAAENRTALEKPATERGRLDELVTDDAFGDHRECDGPVEAPQLTRSGCETRDDARLDGGDDDAPRFDATQSGPAQNDDGTGLDRRIEHHIVIAPAPARQERAVPITRLPLRPQGFDITWTTGFSELEHGASLSRAARHRLLEGLIRNPGNVSGDVVARAYHEEEGDGRPIALRVLLRNFPQTGRSAFIEALRVGSDEERAVAVDGLTAIGAREELTPAFSDRVDAIAAKAALAYIGTLERADYRAELSRFIDEAQIEAILNLLAGIVE